MKQTMRIYRCHLFQWFVLVIWLRTDSSAATCNAQQREALLDFIKPFELQSDQDCGGLSWNMSVDCCTWKGIKCGKTSGHVHSIDLSCLQGRLLSNSTLFKLRFLKVFQLSGNFQHSTIPDDIGKLSKLRVLEIPFANLSGFIPVSLCKLKNLRVLRLSGNSLTGTLPSCLNELPNLQDISMVLNRLEGPLPNWVFTLPSLRNLDLTFNDFSGTIEPFKPPTTTVLERIFLASNRIRGSVLSLFQLVNITVLDMRDNLLSGDIEWNSLKEMRNLDSLDFSGNEGLSFKNSNDAPLQGLKLAQVQISFCNSTEFPTSLSAAENLAYLDVSNNKIGGRIFPRGSGGWKRMESLNASHNLIAGFDEIPELMSRLDLSFNKLQGRVLPLPRNVTELSLSNNQLSGEIPIGFCNATSLRVADLSFNNLSGVLPSCIMSMWSSLGEINLQGNRFHGSIPDAPLVCSFGDLILSDNKFEGTLPRSLKHCTLRVLDVGNNNITDTYPGWLEDQPYLEVLILRSNNFYGEMSKPIVKSPFSYLRILDLSFNSFVGSIQSGFIGSADGMIGDNGGEQYLNTSLSGPVPGIGPQYSYFPIINFSSNRFSGRIPAIFGRLHLRMLNLSNNILSGTIPSLLANISELESLDLSKNMLVGRIPQALMDLSFLEHLNVSYNKLEGPIPTGDRSKLFSNSSYIGNPGLCGLPLSKAC